LTSKLTLPSAPIHPSGSPWGRRVALALLLSAPAALPATLVLLSAPASAADLTGQLRGTVVDADGIGIPGVVVNITSDKLQGARSIDTDMDGNFRALALPPGDYDVHIDKAGFQSKIATIKVYAGRTSQVELTMQLAQAGEEITIVAEKPTVDVTTTRTGIVLTKEMLRDIPNAGRDYQSAATFAPGVVDNGSGNANMRGGTFTSNQYYVDGVNTTDPLTGTFSNNMNFDAIEEFQVLTGGMDAEYGKALGGAVNVVTRSGGNDFEGDIQLLYSGKATRLYKPLPEEGNNSNISYSDATAAANVGGPILKDKLWFFAGTQLNRSVYENTVPAEVGRDEPMAPRYWNSEYVFGKLTWSPTNNQRLWAQVQADPTSIENSTQDPYTLPSGEEWWKQGGWIGSLGHIWTPDASTILETQLATETSYIVTQPIQELWCTRNQWTDCDPASNYGYPNPGWYSNGGFSYGPEPYGSTSYRHRYTLDSSLTRLFTALGEHQAKTGINLELLQSASAFPGVGPETTDEQGDSPDTSGLAYYEPTGDPNDVKSYVPSQLTVYNSQYDSTISAALFAWYLQDVWHPWQRLTLRPGVRLDYGSMYIRPFFDPGFGDSKVLSTLNIAPRMGVAYDLTGDGRTSAHAYYGRFYDPGYLAIPDILTDTDTGSTNYNWDAGHQSWTESGTSSAGYSLAHGDLRTPHSDELDAGLSRDVGDGWGLDLNFAYKTTRNRWEDDEVNLIWNADGTQVVGGRNGTSSAVYRLRTPNEIFNNFTSVELQANRQFDEHWGMVASYTWSKSYGFLQENTTALNSGSFDNYTQNKVDVGLQPYDIPHNLKMAGSYRNAEAIPLGDSTSLGFLGGWNFNASSGAPYRKDYYNQYYQGWYNHKDPIDGTYRLPAYVQLDLKAGLTFQAGRSTWDITAECFNVFNDRTVTSVDTRYGNQDGTGVVTDSNGDPYWGRPQSRQAPRYFQFGLRGEFN